MPIYEYRCQDCHHEFERLQTFSEPPITACPTCAGAVQKLISRSAFHLKGSGWYVTDYGRNGGQKGESPENGAAPEKTTTDTTPSGKRDSKAETAGAASDNGSESTNKSSSKSSSGTAAA